MNAVRRWCLVVLAAVLLIAAPFAGRALPAADSELSAAALLARIQQSDAIAYSGYAESVGTLQLPVDEEFSEVADLLGQRTRLRVWWRGSDDWRVDVVETAGETDVFHQGQVTTTWDYEAERSITTPEPRIRLPRSSDLLPPELARLALADARPDEISRLPASRVAGIDALGLRLDPASPQSTVDHVDVWADPETGLPLRVEVRGVDSDLLAVSTSFLDVSFATPPTEVTTFVPPPGSESDFEEAIDAAAGADQFADVIAPSRLAGLGTRPGSEPFRPVGQYGRGLTTLLAVPLWDPAADPLREQLLDTPGAVVDELGTSLTVGPVTLRLTEEIVEDRSWLVTGTVTADTVDRAARQLLGGRFGLSVVE